MIGIRVHNQGSMMQEESIEAICTPVTQLSAQGKNDSRPRTSLGQGLFVACEIASGYGGTITVRSSDKEGTEFAVRLPPMLPQWVAEPGKSMNSHLARCASNVGIWTPPRLQTCRFRSEGTTAHVYPVSYCKPAIGPDHDGLFAYQLPIAFSDSSAADILGFFWYRFDLFDHQRHVWQSWC